MTEEILGNINVQSSEALVVVIVTAIISFVSRYIHKNLVKHRELAFSQEKESYTKIKELSTIDWSAISQGKALLIQSILKDKFGQNIGIDEFLALIKYPNAIHAINTYIKYRNYYYISDDSKVCIDTKRFETTLGVYNRNWEIFFVTCLSLILSGFLSILGLAISQTTEINIFELIFSIFLLGAGTVFYGATLWIMTKFGEPSSAKKASVVFTDTKQLKFPLQVSGESLIHLGN